MGSFVAVAAERVGNKSDRYVRTSPVVNQTLEPFDGRRYGRRAAGQHPVHVETNAERRLQQYTYNSSNLLVEIRCG